MWLKKTYFKLIVCVALSWLFFFSLSFPFFLVSLALMRDCSPLISFRKKGVAEKCIFFFFFSCSSVRCHSLRIQKEAPSNQFLFCLDPTHCSCRKVVVVGGGVADGKVIVMGRLNAEVN